MRVIARLLVLIRNLFVTATPEEQAQVSEQLKAQERARREELRRFQERIDQRVQRLEAMVQPVKWRTEDQNK